MNRTIAGKAMPKQTSGMWTRERERLHLARFEEVRLIDLRECVRQRQPVDRHLLNAGRAQDPHTPRTGLGAPYPRS